jgi:CoA:oxalate CoA-transferase
VVSDPHVLSREMIVEVNHPQAGRIKVNGFPIKFSETPGRVELAPPLLGQHNEQILRELLGYSPDEVAKLREEKVI